MEFLYNLLWHLAVPGLPLKLWWRGRREPGYREAMPERFGRYSALAPAPVLWVHAVSLGETRAAEPLIRRLRQRYPSTTLLLTHMTATGRSAGRELVDDNVVQAWLPYDLPAFVRRFHAHFRPCAGIVLETEVWPNLLAESRRRGIPVFLVNARLSERSAARYGRLGSFAEHAFASFAGVAAQTDADAHRLEQAGAAVTCVTGNLKFDVAPRADAVALGATLRNRFAPHRPLWLAASTRDGEEALLLDAIGARPVEDAVTLIVPRHPQRFDAVARLLESRGLRYVRRSDDARLPPEAHFVLGDSMGEMGAYCAAADVVVMGGSFLPLGGQNLLEPLAAGKPTLVGPSMFNFAEATRLAVAAGAARQVRDAGEAVAEVAALVADRARREGMAAAAAAFLAAHRGSTDRLWEWLAPQLDRALGLSPKAGG